MRRGKHVFWNCHFYISYFVHVQPSSKDYQQRIVIQRVPLSKDSINGWSDEVNLVIDQIVLRSHQVSVDFSSVPTVNPLILCRHTSQSVSDFLHSDPDATKSFRALFSDVTGELKSNCGTNNDFATLIKWRSEWSRLSAQVCERILQLVLSATHVDPCQRLTSAEMSDIFEELFESVIRLLQRCQRMRLPISDFCSASD